MRTGGGAGKANVDQWGIHPIHAVGDNGRSDDISAHVLKTMASCVGTVAKISRVLLS